MNVKQLFDLTGRVAIVTGGATGLGRQMGEALGELGANLVVCARNKERCEQAAKELKQLGVDALGLGCDVRNAHEIRTVVHAALARFGRIDILINNAGAAWGAPIEEMRLEHWAKVIETNLTGTFLFCQAVSEILISQRRGKIINIASIAGLRGAPPGLEAIGYHASKGGLIAFTKDLACKWAMHNIYVNAIAPGWFRTKMSQVPIDRNEEAIRQRIPLNRFGSDQDLKGAAAFLASDASDFVTGQVLVVDGGQSAW